MRLGWSLAAALWILASIAAQAADAGEETIRDSVVKIYATHRYPDPIRPWMKQNPQEASGTGVVIEGNRILTNAHVVNYASQVFVEGNESSEKIAAKVEAFAPGIDLALLSLEDESFFAQRRPLARKAELPEVKEAVMVYGYPTGGSSLSITKGIVSRIDFSSYGHQTSGLRIQIDAAINPGNSGGPAVVDDKMIGIAFRRLGGADNIGYIIPTEEVELFLHDVTDGQYDGKPAMFDQLQTLENEALRKKLGFERKNIGMVVHEPDQDEASYPLKKWDIITKIGDHEIDNTGMVQVRPNLRLRFHYYIQKLARDGKLPLTVVRDGQELAIELPVRPKRAMLIQELSGRYPSYFVYGPLVFSPVTSEFASAFERMGPGLTQLLSYIGSPLITRRGDKPRFEGEELVVVASPMFPHRIGKGYSNPFAKVVKAINGIEIKNLRHLIEVLRDTKDPYIAIDFDDRGSETIVFDRKEVLNATEEILTDNGVRQQASDDLLPLWRDGKKEAQ
ncbi:MAG: trypsin-like peptidase domain-containing protein [Isosphaeraceae bacterium]|nr:trypsin-like peptidase domain-containing protein [Isosphaeraceae bacterium]